MRKKAKQQKTQFSELKETLIDFFIGNNAKVGVSENEILEQQASGSHKDFERSVDHASQNKVIAKNTDDTNMDAVENAVVAVENYMHDAIWTAMNDVFIPQVEMAVRSVTGSSVNGSNSIIQNFDQKDFTRKTWNTPLRLASSRLDLKNDQNVTDETRDIDISVDGDNRATKPESPRSLQRFIEQFLEFLTFSSNLKFFNFFQKNINFSSKNMIVRGLQPDTSAF